MRLPDIVQYAIPAFVLMIIGEAWLARRRGKGEYETKDAAASLLMGYGNRIALLLTGFGFIKASYAVYAVRLFDLEPAWWLFVLTFFAEDLAYYWFHRLSHERRIWWAAHVVHHSSQYYNLSTALRQPWTGEIVLTGIVWLPLLLIGIPPELVFFQRGVSLVYQFWIHTEQIDRLPAWFEALFNTPSHHRVHHATNPRYLDANYAGILIVWDRLFQSFIPEDPADPCRYGLVKNIGSFNIFKIAFHEWVAIGRDLARAPDWKSRALVLFGPPGWAPDGAGRTSRLIRAEWLARQAAPEEG